MYYTRIINWRPEFESVAGALEHLIFYVDQRKLGNSSFILQQVYISIDV